MMSDELFEALVSNIAPENVQAFLRARDTALHEAIKRLEASLAHACVLLGEADYQARLWEDYQTENEMEVEDHWVTSQVRDRIYKFLDGFKVAELVRSTYSFPRLVSWSEEMSTCTLIFKEREYYFDLSDDCKDDDAQAEQQEAGHGHVTPRADGVVMKCGGPGLCAVCMAEKEAQGAQAGDERAAFERKVQDLAERWQPDYRRYGDVGEYKDATMEWAWTLWRTRAALATQPAAEQLWAVHAQGPDDLFAAFSREDAEANAAAFNDLPCPPGISVSAVVIESPWPAAEHWKYLAEQWKYLADKEQESNSPPASAHGDEAMDELRRSVAEILGQDPDTWPSHGNAPLAIASALALATMRGQAGEGVRHDTN